MSRTAPVVMVAGKPLALQIKRNGLARRISLRLIPGEHAAILVVPPGAKIADAVAFARSRSDWLAARLATQPARIPFQDGTRLPFLGEDYHLRTAPADQRGIVRTAQEIRVPGLPEHFARRVQDWLIKQARIETERRVHPVAARLGHKIGRVRISDPTSRWGSASSRGVLSFSWRLILAPTMVLDYVIAHEVAHLSEMNHSPDFWHIVETLTPMREPAQAWLKQRGAQLHLYG